MIRLEPRLLLALLASFAAAQERDRAPTPYVVLSAVSADDAFDAAARHLAEARDGEIVRFDPADLAPVLATLQDKEPQNVALVMRPEQIDFAFQRAFLQLASQIDDDPFVDFAFGYITGATGDEALALARRGTEREPQRDAVQFASVAGGTDESQRMRFSQRLGDVLVPTLRILCAGEKAFPEAGRDREFLAAELPKLRDYDVVTFIGHGYPHEVHGGPDHRDVNGLELPGAVALNVACYTGTTDRWFETDYRRGRVVEKHVPLDESFCLHVLRSGVVGYTGYVCPRPAGPELDTDRTALVFDGMSLGDARRRDYDKTVLGYLGFGEAGLALDPVRDGQQVRRDRDAVRDIMLEGATGGALFGDPACVPFAARPEDSPVQVTFAREHDGIEVRAEVAANVLFTHCNDPTARWGEQMAMRVHVRVPLGDLQVADVVVDDLRVAGTVAPTRTIWAVERDRGERFLQLKVNFSRQRGMGALSLAARVVATADGAEGRTAGGEPQQPQRGGAGHQAPAAGDPFALAAQREIPREAVEAALAASAATMKGTQQTDATLKALGAFGSDGFRATLVLVECGLGHYRTWQLLEATWSPGDERHLIALLSGPPLPRYGSWTVLRGLGVTDTPQVRALLTERLRDEQDAGMWMSAAQAVAMLGMREHAATIGDRILEARTAWSGVEPHLMAALEQLGGDEAIEQFERIVRSENVHAPDRARAALERLRARQQGGGGR